MVVVSPRGKTKTLTRAAPTSTLSLDGVKDNPEALSFFDAIKKTHDAKENAKREFCRKNLQFFPHCTEKNFTDSLSSTAASFPLESEDALSPLPEESHPSTSACSVSEPDSSTSTYSSSESEDSSFSSLEESDSLTSTCSFSESEDSLFSLSRKRYSSTSGCPFFEPKSPLLESDDSLLLLPRPFGRSSSI